MASISSDRAIRAKLRLMTAERASAAFSTGVGVAAARLARRVSGTRREMCILVEGGLPWEDAEDTKVDLESKLVDGGDGARQRGLYISFHSYSRFILKEGRRTLRRDDSQMEDQTNQ